MSANAAVASRGKYGPSLRTGAVGDLGLFGRKSLSYSENNFTTITGWPHVGKQYGQPVIQSNKGIPLLHLSQQTAARVLETQLTGLRKYVFKPDDLTAVSDSSGRYTLQSRDPAVAYLACVQVLTSTDDNGMPAYGAPFLTVLQAPSVSPAGRPTDATSLWGDTPKLDPIGLTMPADPDPVFFVAASTASEGRATKAATSHDELVSKDALISLEGLSLMGLHWTTTSHPAGAHEGEFYRSKSSDFNNVTADMYVGSHVSPPADAVPNHQAVLVPNVFPLSNAHMLPAGMIWSPTIGSRDFIASIKTLYRDAPAEAKAAASWVESCSTLQVFLDTVAAHPTAFSTPFVARDSVVDSIQVSDDTSEALAPWVWTQATLAWRLQDDINKTKSATSTAETYLMFQSRQTANMRIEHDPWWGNPVPSANPALPALRPPITDTRSKQWGMHLFSVQSMPPVIAEYLRIPLSTQVSGYTSMDHRLQTKEAVEEELAIQQMQSGASPNSKLAANYILSEQRAAKTAATVDLTGAAGTDLFGANRSFTSPPPDDLANTKRAPKSSNTKRQSHQPPPSGNPPPSQPDTSSQPDWYLQQQQQMEDQQRLVQSGQGPPPGHSSVYGQPPHGSQPPHVYMQQPHHQSSTFPPQLPSAHHHSHNITPSSEMQQANHMSSLKRPATSMPLAGTPYYGSTMPPQSSGMSLSSRLASANATPAQSAYANMPSVTPTPVSVYGPQGTFPYSSTGNSFGAQPTVMVLNASSDKRQRHFSDKESTTWQLTATQTHGPVNFNQFSHLLSREMPYSPSGTLVAAQAPIPQSWNLQPANLLPEFRRLYLMKDATGPTALNRFKQNLATQTHDIQGNELKPPLIFGTALFQKKDYFDAFRTDLQNWLALPLALNTTYDENKQFTALHVFTFIPDTVKPNLRFNPQGQTREDMCNALLTFKFLLASAVEHQALFAMSSYQQRPTLNTICTNLLDKVIAALQSAALQANWQGPHKRFTALAFDVFQRGWIIVVAWVANLSSAAFAEALVLDPFGGASSTVLLTNPEKSVFMHQDAALTVQAEIAEWARLHLKRLQEDFWQDNLMHPATPIQMDIFEATGCGIPFAAAPAPAPTAWAQYPTGTDQSQFGSAQHHSTTGGGYKTEAKKGETKSVTRHCAMKPFIKFSAKSKQQHLQSATEILPRLLSDKSVPRPNIQVPTPAKEKQVCFLFAVERTQEVKRCGCTGKTQDRKSKQLKDCDRLHIDFSDPIWTRLGKAAFQGLWDFLQHEMRSRSALSCLSPSWKYWELYGECPLVSPTFPLRRRLSGFGKLNPNLRVSHHTPSPYFVLHKVWDYLLPPDRYKLVQASPAFEAYARLRRSSTTVSVQSLKDPRPQWDTFQGLQHDRAWRLAVALIRFDFNYGDMIRWLGGEYTNDHRDWTEVSDALDSVREVEPPPGYPPIDYERAFRICTEGVPLAGDYCCSFESVRARNTYNNHPNLMEVQNEVRQKLSIEEAQSFHVVLPRFIWRFLPGIHIAPFVWALRKGKGRLCVDPSNTISPTDDGAANANIPPPGTPGREDECPAVHYSTAFQRHITQIWNLRITYPEDDLLQAVDDIQAAFHRILYHPDAMVAFASVFMEFLVLATGSIFGARNSPSFFSLTSESRAHVSSNATFRENDEPENLTALARRVRLVPPPTPRELANFVPAVADSVHQGVPMALRDRYHNSTFVDDNGQVDLRCRIIGAIDNSVRSAYAIYGHPDNDSRRRPPLSEEKWNDFVSFVMIYLGFYIDTRQMLVAWPVDKRMRLAALLDDFIGRKPCIISPQESSSTLGLVRNASAVAPLGVYLSLHLQHALNEAIQQEWQRRSRNRPRRFWQRWCRQTDILVPDHIIQDFRLLRSTLDENPNHPVWSRYIGLLVDREPTHLAFSDASYHGLGAFSAKEHFDFMFRLTREDMVQAGFDMKAINSHKPEPEIDADGLHINVLEFICMIVELWFIIRKLNKQGPIPGGYVITVIGDNTSALSWLRYASRSHSPIVRDLSRFAMGLTLASPISLKLSGRHLAGILNTGADALSRPEKFPTWDSAIEQHSPLETCQPFRVPFKLLSAIAKTVSCAKTGEEYEPEMTKLLTLELSTLSIGSESMSTQSSLSRGTHRSRKSRSR